MLQELLKQETLNNHNELEELMYVHQIMDGSLSLAEYTHILKTNYLVHRAFEARLLNDLNVDLATRLSLSSRNKLGALKKDLLEMQLVEPAGQETSLHFGTDAKILGALYVLEGATLGGNVIVKRLKGNSAICKANPGFYYYQVYGAKLIENWKTFCSVLNEQDAGRDQESLQGAKEMFAYIAQTARLVTQES